jgi:hypothetical protein
MRRPPATVGAALVCLGAIRMDESPRAGAPTHDVVNPAVHRSEPIGSQMAEAGAAGVCFQCVTSVGAVARQLLS